MKEQEMNIRDVAWNTIKWKFIKDRLGCTDEERKKFRETREMRFKRVACFHAGLECASWSRIVMEIRVEDRKKTQQGNLL
jgi:hypothetical protein